MRFRLGLPQSVAAASLARRLVWVTLGRIVVLGLALGVIVLLFYRGEPRLDSFSVRAAMATLMFAFAATAVEAAVLRAGRGLSRLADGTLVVDQLTWTAIVYVSGGAASGATSFYGLTCLVGAALTGLRGASVAAVSAGTMYGGLLLCLGRGWIDPPKDQPVALYTLQPTDLTYYWLLNLLVLVVVTLLAAYFSERLRVAGGEVVRAEERAQSAERLAALGRLAAGLAHEIRNPLGSISGSIQLLSGAPDLGPEDRALCDIIERETRRLNDLVTDMMDLARPRAPEFAPADVAALAREVVVLARGSGRGADVGVRYEGPEHAWIRADAAQLRQLVWNLVRNAVQASTAGDEVRVRIEHEGERLHLDVEDDGPGIEPSARERLFDAFFTTRSQGTGVGLAVVKRIADDHGFEVRVESETGRGARFRVNLGSELSPSEE